MMSATDLDAYPDIAAIRTAAADLNGQARGKRIARAHAAKAFDPGTRSPFSVLNLDIRGEDIEGSPLVFASGDADGLLKPTGRGLLPVPWLETPTALLPIWMFHDDGRPFAGDPRQALARVVERYRTAGLVPVVATEMEFYLIDDSGEELSPPRAPRSGRRGPQADILALGQLDAFDGFLSALQAGCEAMDIPADTITSEAGPGQFEVNLIHHADALARGRRCLAVQTVGPGAGAAPRICRQLYGQTLCRSRRQRPACAFFGAGRRGAQHL